MKVIYHIVAVAVSLRYKGMISGTMVSSVSYEAVECYSYLLIGGVFSDYGEYVFSFGILCCEKGWHHVLVRLSGIYVTAWETSLTKLFISNMREIDSFVRDILLLAAMFHNTRNS